MKPVTPKPIRSTNNVLICLFVFSLLVLSAVVAHADPFLTCDPQEGVTKYRMSLGGIETTSDALADGAAMADLANAPEGTTNGTLAAGGPWTLDGVPQETLLWSTPSPFVLGRPSVSSPPANLSLRDNH